MTVHAKFTVNGLALKDSIYDLSPRAYPPCHPRVPHPVTLRTHPVNPAHPPCVTPRTHPVTPRTHPVTPRTHPVTPHTHPVTPRLSRGLDVKNFLYSGPRDKRGVVHVSNFEDMSIIT